MSYLDLLQQNNTITNTKGGQYYASSYNSNLDLFAGLSRFDDDSKMISFFSNALSEDKDLALANLLYYLDIRGGKGERRIFKVLFKHLCKNYPNEALRILPFISNLGRYDYILAGLSTPIQNDVISLIKNQLSEDLNSDHPSLLAKWLPSHRTHNNNNAQAKIIYTALGMKESEYRKLLSKLRGKLNIVEKNLTTRSYDNINFEHVPSKAMLKYDNSFESNIKERYNDYLDSLKKGDVKVNTAGLFPYEIVRKIYREDKPNAELLDAMWKGQKDFINDLNTNVLVVADTSGSMTCCGGLPYAASLSLAIYTAERNTGVFKDTFITFSSNPKLQTIKGANIVEKVNNIQTIIANTNIDKVFKLLLDTAVNNKVAESEMPSHIVIVSDMEFDDGVYSKGGTNFKGWKEAFNNSGYNLPKIIFWNVAAYTEGFPVTKYDKDCIMVSGFSTSLFEHILTLEDYSPVNEMMVALEKYLNMLK